MKFREATLQLIDTTKYCSIWKLSQTVHIYNEFVFHELRVLCWLFSFTPCLQFSPISMSQNFDYQSETSRQKNAFSILNRHTLNHNEHWIFNNIDLVWV